MMYENAEEAIARILVLVEKCPDSLKEKCFEVLLRGYVERELATSSVMERGSERVARVTADTETDLQIPQAVLPRFKTTAKRAGIELSKLASLFDFGNDPFTFHALVVPGKSKAEKTRKVALLVAAKSYLATGNWIADWQEVKAECVNQNCYDAVNQAVNLKAGEGESWFKSVEVGKNLDLSVEGVKEAEKLLSTLAQAE